METDKKANKNMWFDSYPAPFENVAAYTRKHSQTTEVEGYYFTKLLLNILLKWAQSLSWKTAYRVGTGIGNLLYGLKLRRDVAMTNLDIVYGETKPPFEKERIYRESLLNLGRIIVNYLRLPYMGPDFWQNNWDWKNEEIIKDAFNRKKGVILVSGHIGMMELVGGKLGMCGYPLGFVGKKIKNPVINKLVLDSRRAMNVSPINYKDSAIRILRGIRSGEAIGMAIDQNMTAKYGTFIDWMGRPAMSVTAPAMLARRTGAAVIVGYSYQKAIDRFEVVITEEVAWEACPGDPKKEIAINNQNQANAVQRIIYAHPELWFWIHRRWKRQPDGMSNPYKQR
ncbi:MAG: lysophospholipid acyltransferase family protein [Deltaproteobacteria bacterium]|nr:lysophospholipid acyltransferase family protein [Deltaproteobacteria bacterium]